MTTLFRRAATSVCGPRTAVIHVKFADADARAARSRYYFYSPAAGARELERTGMIRLARVAGEMHAHTHRNGTGKPPLRDARFACVAFGRRPDETHVVVNTDIYKEYLARCGVRPRSLLLPPATRPEITGQIFDPKKNLG